MIELPVKVETYPFYEPSTLEIAKNAFDIMTGDGIVALECAVGLSNDDEDDPEIEMFAKTYLWVKQGNTLEMSDLHSVSEDIKMRFGGPAYALLSRRDLDAVATEIYKELTDDLDHYSNASVIALRHGLIVMVENPHHQIYYGPDKNSALDPGIAQRFIRFIAADCQSAHARIQFGQDATDFINLFLKRSMADRGQPEANFFDNVKVVVG